MIRCSLHNITDNYSWTNVISHQILEIYFFGVFYDKRPFLAFLFEAHIFHYDKELMLLFQRLLYIWDVPLWQFSNEVKHNETSTLQDIKHILTNYLLSIWGNNYKFVHKHGCQCYPDLAGTQFIMQHPYEPILRRSRKWFLSPGITGSLMGTRL